MLGSNTIATAGDHSKLKGYGITPTGLKPSYPAGFNCSPLTSLYASWIDVDGSRRDEPHSGVDGGRLNEWILAPGPGVVKAVWKANWGWGSEGALLIMHSKADLNLREGANFYYSEFDHLKYGDIKRFKVGDKVARGDPIAPVFRPGGKSKYLAEVHWEVWEVTDGGELRWSRNKVGGRKWESKSAELIDPLYLLSRQIPQDNRGYVFISPFLKTVDYREFKGFTYILPCRAKKRRPSLAMELSREN